MNPTGGSGSGGKAMGAPARLSDAEVEARRKIVAARKAAVGGRGLTEHELDALIDPIECLRTRSRLGKENP